MTDHPLLFRLRGVPAGSAVERVLLAGDRARAAQGEEIPALIWDAEPPALEEFAAQEGRHFNWIPGSDAAAMNGRFFRSLQAARVQAERAGRGDAFSCVPRTWLLPDDYPEFHAAARRMPGNPYIWRHRALAAPGLAGILANPYDAGHDAQFLIQDYVKEPHLLSGYKYTLRFFLAVTSLAPLVVWRSSFGLCRFASQPFSYVPGSKTERFRHVTTPEALAKDETVSLSWQNTTLAAYRARLQAEANEKLDPARVEREIEAALQTALAALREPILALAKLDNSKLLPGQFQLFAADVTLDESLHPHLLGLHANPRLAVGEARNLPVASREDELYESLARDLLKLVGALDNEAPAAIPTSLVELSAWLQKEDARAGSFERLFPNPRSAHALPALELREADLKLAFHLRETDQRQLQVLAATAHPLDGGLLIASEHRAAKLLEGTAAQLWQQLARGESVEAMIASLEGADAENQVWAQLTDWFRAGLVGWDLPAATPVRASVRWNPGRLFEVDGLRVLVRGGGPQMEALLHPLLAPFERSPGPLPDRSYDLVNHDDGFALLDSSGKRRWRGTDASLGPVLLGLIREESMRAAGRLGAVEALFLREKQALILAAPGLFRGLAAALEPLGFSALGAPLFLSARESLSVSEQAGEEGWHPKHLLVVEVDRGQPELSKAASPFAALGAIFRGARAAPQLSSPAAETLCSSLAKLRLDSLSAHSVASAAKQIVESFSEVPRAAIEPAGAKLSIAR
jgi:hypothetical protein